MRILFGCLVLLFAVPALAGAKQAETFVTGLGSQAVNVLQDAGLQPAQKRATLSDLFARNVDVEWIGRFVLGRHYRTLSEPQRQRFMTVYGEFLRRTYTSRFEEYTGVEFTVLGSTEAGPQESLVQTRVQVPGKAPIKVDYRIVETAPGTFKVTDIVVEGVSLLTTQRSEFSSVINRDGVDTLISRIESKLQTL